LAKVLTKSILKYIIDYVAHRVHIYLAHPQPPLKIFEVGR